MSIITSTSAGRNFRLQLLRYGMKMQMPEEFSQIEYYGEGPQENYIDRRNWQHIRVWGNRRT